MVIYKLIMLHNRISHVYKNFLHSCQF